jgi:hypothetical protein
MLRLINAESLAYIMNPQIVTNPGWSPQFPTMKSTMRNVYKGS